MRYEWSPDKDITNLKKHGISINEACQIFENDVFTWIDKRKDYNETRIISIGSLDGEIIIVVVHTDRNGITRIISARPDKKKERRLYNKKKKKTS